MTQSMRCATLLALMLGAAAASAETYIIPIWAAGSLPGSDGSWTARAIGVNANPFPVMYRVTGVYPMSTDACRDCTGVPYWRTIEAGASVQVTPLQQLPGLRMTAGAFAIETTAPLTIHLVAFGGGQLRQRIEVARRWVAPGRHTISGVERGGRDWRMNLLVTNPRETPVTVTAWAGSREENETRQTIPGRTTAVLPLSTPHCNGVPCPFTTEYPPMPIRVQVEADGEVLTSVSSLGATWAMFSLADTAQE